MWVILTLYVGTAAASVIFVISLVMMIFIFAGGFMLPAPVVPNNPPPQAFVNNNFDDQMAVDRPPDRPRDNKPVDPIDAALTEMRSEDGFARARAANALAHMQPEDNRRDEVLVALLPLLTDANQFAQQAAERAQVTWKRPDVVVKPPDPPRDPNKDRPLVPVKPDGDGDAVALALADLQGASTRKRGAEILARMNPVNNRRVEVLTALQKHFLDPDLATRKAVQHARAVWTGQMPPDRETGDPGDKPKDPLLKPGEEIVEWQVKPDPYTDKPPQGTLNLQASLPVSIIGPMIYSSSPHGTALGTPPPSGGEQIQFVDLRQMKPVSKVIPGRFAAFGAKVNGVSADAAYFAYAVPNAPKPTVEVIALATTKSIHKIEVTAAADWKVHYLEFPGKDRLLTAAQQGEVPLPDSATIYQVWDLKTGKEICKFDFPLAPSPKWTAISPGGKYLVLQVTEQNDYPMIFWDLTTGKIVGKFAMQDKSEPWGQGGGLAFSPDGEKLTLLWRLARKPTWGRVRTWDLKTQKKLQDIELGYEYLALDRLWLEGGMKSLQWIPDGSGWLLCEHLLLDAQAEAVVWTFTPEPKTGVMATFRRFLDQNHTSSITAGLNRRLVIETVPWDKIEPVRKEARAKKKTPP